MSILSGIHPIAEALKAHHPLERVLVTQGAGGPRLQEIIDLARRASVPIRFEPRAALDRLAGSPAHQGVVAMGAASRYAELESVAGAELLVVLDGVEDPHNLGAVIRTAHAAGALAVVVPDRRSAPLNETVAKAAAGALSILPVVRGGNLNRTLEQLKEHGFWIYGLDERGDRMYTQADFAGRAALVVGGEGPGLHDQVRKKCDFLLRIPMAGQIASLNVSVATGIVLFEWARGRGFAGGPEGA